MKRLVSTILWPAILPAPASICLPDLMRQRTAVCASLIIALFAPPAVGQTAYKFVNIADTSGPFSALGSPLQSEWFAGVDINTSGEVAFIAVLDAGGAGVYRHSAGRLVTIADSAGPFSGFTELSLNDAGVVAFTGGLDAKVGGVFTGDGGIITTIIDTNGPFTAFMGVSINNAGEVAFGGKLDSTADRGYFKVSGGSITTIAYIDRPFRDFRAPAINDAGVVAFQGQDYGTGISGIYTGSGGPLSTIVEGSIDPRPSINNSGLVAFSRYASAATGSAIYKGDGGSLDLFVSSDGPFKSLFPCPDINDHRAVVFRATLDGGGLGIYTGVNPATDKVVEIGDAMFGSTLVRIYGFPRLNDRGDVVFEYALASGVRGIAVALVVPEPACGALGLMALAALWLSRSRA